MLKKILSLVELPSRILGPLSKFQQFPIEQEFRQEYSICRQRVIRKKGTTALLRVKNEEVNLESVVKSISSVFEEIVIVDNNSTDKTHEIAKRLQSEYAKIKLYQFPFELKRCGVENANTDELSIYGLPYFYNWSISQCNYSYIMKWDGDMILASNSIPYFKKLLSDLSCFWPTYVAPELQTVYRKDSKYYESVGEVNSEYMIFPNRSDVYFKKAEFFEKLQGKLYKTISTTLDNLRIFELKDLAIDEFSHWDTTEFTTERKKLEYKRFQELKDNKLDNFRLIKI